MHYRDSLNALTGEAQLDASSSRWHEITPSSFDHERAALRYVRDLLPDRAPYQAWSNFTFMSDQGHIREVDLLVAAPTGLFLIEIKNYRGRLTNHGSTWRLPSGRTFDNPLPLADQKAKELKSRTGWSPTNVPGSTRADYADTPPPSSGSRCGCSGRWSRSPNGPTKKPAFRS